MILGVNLRERYSHTRCLGMDRVDMINIVQIIPLVLALVGLLGIGAQEAHAQTALWYDDQGDHDCIYDGPYSPSVTNLLGCPLDHMRHVAGLPQLVGSWNIVNQTGSGIDRNLTGIMTFGRNGTMEFQLPTSVVYDASGDTSDTMQGSWGVNEHGHLLTIAFSSDNAVNMTFIRKSPNYMELVDSHGDRIHLTRYWLTN
jgi:hypothetical protein